MSFYKSLIYPKSLKFKITLAISCSLFIYLFLIFFQPFGVNNYNPTEHISLELASGLLIIIPTLFITICFNEFIIRPRFILNNTSWVYISWVFYFFISVGTASFLLYNILGNFHDFSFSSYFSHVIEISSVLVFPFFITILFFSYQNMIKNYAESLTISNSLINPNDVILIKGDYKNNQIALPQNAIICMQSEDNYLELTYLENEKVKKYLIRSTLGKMDEILNSELFIRCNRSIIINLFHLESIKKVSSGLFVKLKSIDNPIKVSKANTQKLLMSTEKYVDTSLD